MRRLSALQLRRSIVQLQEVIWGSAGLISAMAFGISESESDYEMTSPQPKQRRAKAAT